MYNVNHNFPIYPYEHEMDELYKAIRIFESKHNLNKSPQAICHDMLMKYAQQLIAENKETKK